MVSPRSTSNAISSPNEEPSIGDDQPPAATVGRSDPGAATGACVVGVWVVGVWVAAVWVVGVGVVPLTGTAVPERRRLRVPTTTSVSTATAISSTPSAISTVPRLISDWTAAGGVAGATVAPTEVMGAAVEPSVVLGAALLGAVGDALGVDSPLSADGVETAPEVGDCEMEPVGDEELATGELDERLSVCWPVGDAESALRSRADTVGAARSDRAGAVASAAPVDPAMTRTAVRVDRTASRAAATRGEGVRRVGSIRALLRHRTHRMSGDGDEYPRSLSGRPVPGPETSGVRFGAKTGRRPGRWPGRGAGSANRCRPRRW